MGRYDGEKVENIVEQRGGRRGRSGQFEHRLESKKVFGGCALNKSMFGGSGAGSRCRAVGVLFGQGGFHSDEQLRWALLVLQLRVGMVANLGQRAVKAVKASGGCRSVHIDGGHRDDRIEALSRISAGAYPSAMAPIRIETGEHTRYDSKARFGIAP